MSLVYTLRKLHDDSPLWLRQVGAAVSGRIPPRWRYGAAFRRAWDLTLEAPGWTAGQRAAYQLGQLRRMLALAGSRVPYYRRLFAAIGFEPARVTGIPDLRVLPLLTREMVRELGDDLLPDGRPPAQSKFSTTGGTTGKPLGFWITHDASAAEWAFLMAGWRTAGFRPGDRRVVVRGRVVEGRRGGRLYEMDFLNHAMYLSGFDIGPETLEACLAAIRRYRPRFFHAFPSSATVVAHFLEQTGQVIPGLEALLLGSENIYAGQREYLERVFGCRVFTWYGHSEKSIFAPECRCGRTYRVMEEYGATELVDPRGNPITEPGRPGLLAGTGFINEATVFVRYLTDDQAEWADSPCPGCGAGGRLLRGIVGRWNQEFLVGRSGAMIPISAVNLHTRVYTAMRQFQFRQEVPGQAALLAVKADGFTSEDDSNLRRELEARLGGEVSVDLQYVPALPLTAAGKFKWVDQRLPLAYPSWPAGGAPAGAGPAPQGAAGKNRPGAGEQGAG